MKISYNWLKDYVALDLSPERISVLLTDCGLEVEGLEKVESIKGGLEGLVIGEVLTCVKHPNADTLSITTVDVGGENPLNIVCGASNVAAGQKVVVATVGTTLYSNDDSSFVIKKAKKRGELSEGMICAEDEIGLGNSHDGIMVLDNSAVPGTPAKKYFDIEEDYVFEIGLTPNRSDAMGHIGVALDLKALYNTLKDEDIVAGKSLNIPSVAAFKVDNTSYPVEVIIEDEAACPRYCGLTMTGVEVKESPDWLKNRLNAVGIRPINNIVDISNYVLMETGHPTHVFDGNEIKGDKVLIRKPAKGTKFTTLDEVERTLCGDDLMICNAEEGMCIAGVFGGITSGVKEGTSKIFIESAYFDAATVRKTAKFHTLQTDASFRFERGADVNNTVYALKRVALMIKELAGGEISSEIVDVYPNKIPETIVDVHYATVWKIIGKNIPKEEIKTILLETDIRILEENDERLKLQIPSNKVDVTREIDVIEEILRIYGYNNIALSDEIHSSLSYASRPDKDKLRNLISDFLSSNGFAEIMNNSLTKSSYVEMTEHLSADNNIAMLNPLSRDLDVLRQSLLFGGLENVAYNLNRKAVDLKFYEFGKTYQVFKNEDVQKPLDQYKEEDHLAIFISGNTQKESWIGEVKTTDFFYLKSFVENILRRLGVNMKNLKKASVQNDVFADGLVYNFKKRMLVEFGSVSKKILKGMEIKQAVYYANFNWDLLIELIKFNKIQFVPTPKFPAVRRDLALVLDKSVSYQQVEEIAWKYGGKLLKEVNLFDIYDGEKIEAGKKSYSISFMLQNPEKTLKDKEIDKLMRKLMSAYERELNALIRK